METIFCMSFAEHPHHLINQEENVADTLRKKIRLQIAKRSQSREAFYLRGAEIAAIRLFNLFTRGKPEQAWLVNVLPEYMDQVGTQAQSNSISGVNLRWAALPRAFHKVPGQKIRLWCDLNSLTAARSLHLRSSFAQEMYPILSIHHTLSVPTLLQGTIAPLLMNQSLSCDRQICSTEASAASLQALLDYQREKLQALGMSKVKYHGKIKVVPIPTDTDRFMPGIRAEARKRLGFAQNAFVLLYFGYIGMAKSDLSLYLSSLKRLTAQAKGRKLLWCIAGTAEPPYLAFFKKQVRELGLQQHVYIETDVSANDKVLFYQAADVFVSPSDTVQESFGMTVVEAMACGIPQLVSDWNGYRELVVHGETGFRVRTLWANCTDEFKMPYEFEVWGRDHIGLSQSVAVDLEDWYRRLETLFLNEDLRRSMGEASRRRALKYYANPIVAGMHRELWREAEAECAGSIEPFIRKQELSAPDYFRCFNNYASALVKDATLLCSAGVSAEMVARALDAYRGLPAMESLLEPGLVLDLFSHFEGCTATLEAVCTKANAVSVSTARRHVMWLIKQGFLQAARNESD